MRNSLQKIVCLCLAVVLLLVVCGCRDKKDPSGTSQHGSSAENTSSHYELVEVNGFTVLNFEVLAFVDGKAVVVGGTTLGGLLAALQVEEGFRVEVQDETGAPVTEEGYILLDSMTLCLYQGEELKEQYPIEVRTAAELEEIVEIATQSSAPAGSAPTPSGQTPSATAGVSSALASAPTSTSSAPQVDKAAAWLKGRTIKLGTMCPSNYNVTFSESRAIVENINRIEAKYGCKIELVEYNSETVANVVTNEIMSGIKNHDILEVQAYWGRCFARENVIVDLKQNAPQIDMKIYDTGGTDGMTIAGKRYAVSAPYQQAALCGVYFNKDIIKKYAPQYDVSKLFASGDWTFDIFREIMRKCTVKDGKKTVIYGMSGNGYETGFALSAAAGGTCIMQNDRVIPAICATDEGINTMVWLKDIYRNDKTWHYTSDFLSEFMNGQVAFMPCQSFYIEQIGENCAFNLGFVPFPKPTKKDEYVSPLYDWQFFTVSKSSLHENSAHMDSIALIINELGQASNGYINARFNNYKNLGLDSASISAMTWMVSNTTPDWSIGVDNSTVHPILTNSIVAPNKEPASECAAIREQFQALCDDFYGPFYNSK